MNQPPVAVKICGLTRAEDAMHAENCGASYLGVILAGGPRVLTPHRARSVLGPRRPGVRRVAVFGTHTVADVLAIADEIDLDVIQLHGTQTAETVRHIRAVSGRHVWPVVRVAGAAVPPEATALADEAGTLVLDALVAGQLGGTGVALDWSGLQDAIASLRAAVPGVSLVLAGGLRPTNVGHAIGLLSPSVVDVSSGVESAPGVKDPALVQQFVRAARVAPEMQR